MITGLTPASVAVGTFVIGLSPGDLAFSPDMNSSAAAVGRLRGITGMDQTIVFERRLQLRHLLDRGVATDASVLEDRVTVLVRDSDEAVRPR